MAARANKRTRADAAILDRLECDSRGAQTPLESGQTQLTFDNKLSSSDGILAGPSCAADPQTPDIYCDKSQSEGEAGDSDHAAIVDIEQGRAAVGTEAVPRADFDNLQAVVRQIADQMKWFTDKVSEDMALEGTDAVVDVPPLDSEQDNAELGPVPATTVRAADGDADEADAQGQGLILNDLQAFYADNEKVGADIDPQLSSIIENLTRAACYTVMIYLRGLRRLMKLIVSLVRSATRRLLHLRTVSDGEPCVDADNAHIHTRREVGAGRIGLKTRF